jgi:hypothetical protein
MNPNHWRMPTKAQEDAALRVQKAVCQELNLLSREGVEPAALLAGAGAALADLITSVWGIQAVAPWFDKQGEMTADLLRGGH